MFRSLSAAVAVLSIAFTASAHAQDLPLQVRCSVYADRAIPPMGMESSNDFEKIVDVATGEDTYKINRPIFIDLFEADYPFQLVVSLFSEKPKDGLFMQAYLIRKDVGTQQAVRAFGKAATNPRETLRAHPGPDGSVVTTFATHLEMNNPDVYGVQAARYLLEGKEESLKQLIEAGVISPNQVSSVQVTCITSVRVHKDGTVLPIRK